MFPDMAVGQQRQQSTMGRGSNVPIAGGFVGGLAAYVVGFVVIFAVKSSAINNNLTGALGQLGQLGGANVNLPGAWQVAGWVFYGAHNAGVTATASGMGMSRSQAVNLHQGALWEAWFLIVPVVLLVVAGFAVASTATSWDAVTGFQAGASVTLGYGLLAIVGVFLTKWSFSLSQGGVTVTASVGPDIVTGILLVGIVYPVVFGGVGGAIAGLTN